MVLQIDAKVPILDKSSHEHCRRGSALGGHRSMGRREVIVHHICHDRSARPPRRPPKLKAASKASPDKVQQQAPGESRAHVGLVWCCRADMHA
jgi:hypothetical protein